MTDSELRGVILRRFYDRRRESYIFLKPEEFGLREDQAEWEDILRICEQLGEQGLIDWKSQGLIGKNFSPGAGKITAYGVDVIEGKARASSAITIDNRQYVFNQSSNNVVG